MFLNNKEMVLSLCFICREFDFLDFQFLILTLAYKTSTLFTFLSSNLLNCRDDSFHSNSYKKL